MWQPTHIQLTVQRAKDLLVKGKNGTNDCFVVIGLGKEKYQTSVKEKSLPNVEWLEECELTIPKQGNTAEVKLTVFHRNFLGVDEFLGQTLIPLSDFDTYERSKNRWYQLRSKPEKKDTKPRGSLEVRVAFTVKAAPSASAVNLSGNSGKHHSSMVSVVTSLGGSVSGLNRKKMKSVKKLASAVGSKLSLNRRGSVSRSDRVDCDVESDLWGDDGSSNADPGVISEGEEGEFGFDDHCRAPKASEFGATVSGFRSGPGVSLAGTAADETPLSSLSSSLQSALSDRVDSPSPAVVSTSDQQVPKPSVSTTSLQRIPTIEGQVSSAGAFDRSSPLRCVGESLRRRSSLSPVTKRSSDSTHQQVETSSVRNSAESQSKSVHLDPSTAYDSVTVTVGQAEMVESGDIIATAETVTKSSERSRTFDQSDAKYASRNNAVLDTVSGVETNQETGTSLGQSETVSDSITKPANSSSNAKDNSTAKSRHPVKALSKSLRNSRDRFTRRKPLIARNESSPMRLEEETEVQRPLSDQVGDSSSPCPGVVSSVSLMTLSRQAGSLGSPSGSGSPCVRVVEGGNERAARGPELGSRLSASVRRRFDTMSREDLIEQILQLQEQLNTSQQELAHQKLETDDMKEYLDRLLVRVMEQQPDLLQNSLHRLTANNKYISRVL